mmetsp:Transcript_2601/g.7887  ORF Transcript_2601/g.7887 Transcript_2601/m.7887 type:complete len:243 (-) Transcript_2601:569-1297(-)
MRIAGQRVGMGRMLRHRLRVDERIDPAAHHRGFARLLDDNIQAHFIGGDRDKLVCVARALDIVDVVDMNLAIERWSALELGKVERALLGPKAHVVVRQVEGTELLFLVSVRVASVHAIPALPHENRDVAGDLNRARNLKDDVVERHVEVGLKELPGPLHLDAALLVHGLLRRANGLFIEQASELSPLTRIPPARQEFLLYLFTQQLLVPVGSLADHSCQILKERKRKRPIFLEQLGERHHVD